MTTRTARQVYITFLGASNYSSTEYTWTTGNDTHTSPYGQESELIMARRHNGYVPDVVYVFATEIATKANWESWCGYNYHKKTYFEDKGSGLEPRLRNCLPESTVIELVTIEDGLESHAQWNILEQLLAKVEDNDELVFDITHGYRVTPVILSSALHFLRITKSIRLRHIYYAAFETDDKRIIDYADFYNIQDLTEGVARLAEEADMRKLLDISKKKRRFPIDLSLVRGGTLFQELEQLTNAVRNVESHFVGVLARTAMNTLTERIGKAQRTGRIIPHLLLRKINAKFHALAYDEETNRERRFNPEYFRVQLELMRLLIDHQLYMQAYTLQREYIGSLGMIFIPNSTWRNCDGRKERGEAGECFIMRVQFAEEYNSKDSKYERLLEPHYQHLVEHGLAHRLQNVLIQKKPIKGINAYRNNLDHACTSVKGLPEGWETAAAHWMNELEQITDAIFALPPTPEIP